VVGTKPLRFLLCPEWGNAGCVATKRLRPQRRLTRSGGAMSEICAEELRKVLAAITTTPHRHIGIRPTGSVPAEAPCFLLSEPTLHALMYQLDNARW